METKLMEAILKELEVCDPEDVIFKMRIVLTIIEQMPSYMVNDVIRAAFGIEKEN